MTDTAESGMRRAVTAAGGTSRLAETWGVSPAFVSKCLRQGFAPIDKARQAADTYGIPLRDLVRADIQAALDAQG